MVKVAVVTGGNKGIGLSIVRGLCESFDGTVYLTCRNEERGAQAISELQKENLKPKFYQLDVTDESSVMRLKEHIVSRYGGLDVLINNAGVSYLDIPPPQQVDETIETNYNSVQNICNILFPILRKGARVVHLSSTVGNIALAQNSKHLTERITSAKSVEEVGKIMEEFRNAAKDGTWKEKGWADNVYGISKSGVTVITKIQQAMFDADQSRTDIIVNACCPGFVDTDMTRSLKLKHDNPKTPDEGADTPLYLALLPAHVDQPRGCFCRDRVIYDEWHSDPFVETVQ